MPFCGNNAFSLCDVQERLRLETSVKSAVGINNNTNAVSLGGQTVDMTGNWDYKKNVGGKISDYDNIIKQSAQRLNLDWRLCAALCYVESNFNPNAKNGRAKGMWQIIYWSESAPKGYKNDEYAFNPEISTLGFENIMSKHLNKFKNAQSRNDQIALAIQCYHDGSINEKSPLNWAKRIPGICGKDEESYQYVPKILKRYRKYCS